MGQWFGQGEGMDWLQNVALALGPGQPLYILLFSVAIIFFCYFYTAIVFNPKDVADNLKNQVLLFRVFVQVNSPHGILIRC